MRTDALLDEAREARDAFFATLETVAPDSMTTPGLVGEMSARELIAHLGYWTGHAVEAIHRVEVGRADEDDLDGRSVDEVDEAVARVARQTPLATVRKREAASFDALVERIGSLDPAWLDVPLVHHGSLEAAIRDDGPDHYREHGDELRRILAEPPHG